MGNLERIKEWFPWPDEKPCGNGVLDGWFAGDNQFMLSEVLSDKTAMVCEIGSWQGVSARFLCEHAPNATIICIDTWLGSIEHRINPEWRTQLPLLYETFLANMWDYRERVVPMRQSSTAGIHILHDHKIAPEVFYLDAAHDELSVRADLWLLLWLFPRAIVIGDDWTLDSVQRAVYHCTQERGRELISLGTGWKVLP